MVESVGEGVTTVEVGDHVIPCYAVRPSGSPVPSRPSRMDLLLSQSTP